MSNSPTGSLADIKIDILHDVQDDFKKTVHYLLKSVKNGVFMKIFLKRWHIF